MGGFGHNVIQNVDKLFGRSESRFQKAESGVSHSSQRARRRVFLFNLHVTKYLWSLCMSRETKKLLSEPFKILILDLFLITFLLISPPLA